MRSDFAPAAVLLCLLCCRLPTTVVVGSDSSSDSPVRHTKYGRVVGYTTEVDAFRADVFESVPFARPPVQQLRFEYPEEPLKWSGMRNCTQMSLWCIQFWYTDFKMENRPQSEDCLYLRIMAPAMRQSSQGTHRKFPVLVWFHGGSYQVNGANMFPVRTTIKNIVAQGTIVVYANYRLGPFGFMSTLNAEFGGNYGLDDMVMAVKWVNENIANFGGDPTNVTVGGESAGAAAASILAVSPRTKGLFHRAILRSGSATAPWAVRSVNTDLNSMLIIKWSSCNLLLPDMQLVKVCLRTVSVAEFANYWIKIGTEDIMYILTAMKQKPSNKNHPFLAHTYFTPVVDAYRQNGSVIPTFPTALIVQNARMPIMIGVTTGECSSYVTWIYFITSEPDVKVDRKDLDLVIPSTHFANGEQVKQAAYRHYIVNRLWTKPLFSYFSTLVEIASDQNFGAPAVLEAKLYTEANQSAYSYIFDHTNSQLESRLSDFGLHDDSGAGHGYDMVFLYESTSVLDPNGEDMNFSAADHYVSEFLSKTLVAFVKTGNPTVGSLPSYWPPYVSLDCGQSALRISAAPRLTAFLPEVYRFWLETIPLLDSLTFARDYRFLHDDQNDFGCRRSTADASSAAGSNSSFAEQTCGGGESASLRLLVYVLLVMLASCVVCLVVACCLLRQRRTAATKTTTVDAQRQTYVLAATEDGAATASDVKV